MFLLSRGGCRASQFFLLLQVIHKCKTLELRGFHCKKEQLEMNMRFKRRTRNQLAPPNEGLTCAANLKTHNIPVTFIPFTGRGLADFTYITPTSALVLLRNILYSVIFAKKT